MPHRCGGLPSTARGFSFGGEDFAPLNFAGSELAANNIISVGACSAQHPTNSMLFMPMFSNMGAGGKRQSIFAPGHSIVSTAPGESCQQMSGTSMAAPRVTGAAALAREAFKADSGNAKTGVKSLGVSAWLGKTLDLSGGGLRLVPGAGCIRHDLKSRRSVTVGAVTEALGADYQGSSWQAFAEAAWGFSKESLVLEPCLALGWMGLKTGGFAERGGSQP